VTTTTSISVVVATHQRPMLVDRCLRTLAAQALPPTEVIVIDDAPKDDTPSVLRKWVRRPSTNLRAERLEVNGGEIGRILRFKEIRPHHVAQWLHSEDLEFLPKAEAVCDLYLNPPKGAVVVCVDEKPMQALERRHPTHVSRDDGTVRYEYEYKHHGTQVLLAVKTAGSRAFGVDGKGVITQTGSAPAPKTRP
jgi:cellulose synthase/poly-beta-1,6-N-acetylglucosamine synthase-like glycosyltransferase